MAPILSLLATCLAAIVVGCTTQAIMIPLPVREYDKLCSPWTNAEHDSISPSSYDQRECSSPLEVEQNDGQTRFCCPARPVGNFPTECGKQLYQPLIQRIVGGMHAIPNSWPWQVIVRSRTSQCGGTLIDRQHVLTAAHCIQVPVQASDYKVIVGLHDMSVPLDMQEQIVAKNIWPHEQFNNTRYEDDVAVIRLSRPVDISETVNVICLPGVSVGSAINKTVWVSGWGNTANGGSASPQLKQTSLYTMGDKCKIFGAANFNTEKQLCAGRYTKDGDACQGDSGGPLMFESNRRWFLNGVVSYGYLCGELGHPGVYARVTYYLPWIRSKMALP